MDNISRFYPKDIAISIQPFPLDERLKNQIIQEMMDKPFIMEELKRLMEPSIYHQIKQDELTQLYSCSISL